MIPIMSSIRKTLIWNSGFLNLADIIRTSIFRRVLDSCIKNPSIMRVASMKILHNFCMHPREIRLITQVLRSRGPCRLLIFGLGNDSTYWRLVNGGGRTVFIEDDPIWLERITRMDPEIEAFLVSYGTRRVEWKRLLRRPDGLQMYLPTAVLDREWDVILVDAPKGARADNPGRMKSIFIASLLRASDSDVFIHDCNREVERVYSERYLGKKDLKRQVIRLRHYCYSEYPDKDEVSEPFTVRVPFEVLTETAR
ncbi:MAG: hypothetical protein JXA64_12390 [Candidatus Fermentibacteraceae bacterium]|nr:hypothetical protein [Candidatus Fermentibacteraceae bacterium]MBN2609899.1 hypothetical protein [Candidatus Fermentibacteraceae bacterium]